jgi:hypothetical protein
MRHRAEILSSHRLAPGHSFKAAGISTREKPEEGNDMARSVRNVQLVAIAAIGMLVLICAAFQMYRIAPISNLTQNSLPTDAQLRCPFMPGEFEGWFDSGTPTLDGLVKPANSLEFPDTPNCPFYKWSEQMFLWITSPVGDDHSV